MGCNESKPHEGDNHTNSTTTNDGLPPNDNVASNSKTNGAQQHQQQKQQPAKLPMRRESNAVIESAKLASEPHPIPTRVGSIDVVAEES